MNGHVGSDGLPNGPLHQLSVESLPIASGNLEAEYYPSTHYATSATVALEGDILHQALNQAESAYDL